MPQGLGGYDGRMTKVNPQREKIVRAAAELLRKRGYAATGINEILALSGAPKGSLYHYFPGGKEQVAAEAVRHAGAKVRATLDELATRHGSAADVLRAYGALLAGWMARSAFTDGCPIATTMLEVAPARAEITAAGRQAFEGWQQVFAEGLVREGRAPERAEALAAFAVTALEGALVLARVRRSERPILLAVEEVAATFERG